MRSKATISRAAIRTGAASTISPEVREHAPAEDRQPAPGEPRRPHGRDRDDQVEPEQRHRDADQGEEEDVGVEAEVRLVVERRVPRPAGREAAEEDRRDEDHPGRHQQPEGERLDPREGHPPRADHQRHEVVRERPEDPRAHHPHHHRAVQADDRQVVAGAEELRRGAQQLGPDQHRVQPADEEEDADPDQVLHADHLVVGAEAEVARRSRPPRSRGARARGPASCVSGYLAKPSPTRNPITKNEVAEHQGDVVLVRVGEVLEALRVDLVAQPPAEVEAGDPEHDAGEEVEARAARAPAGGGRRGGVHPALLSGSGR